MNAVESYRQARKIGWSRRQNKYGVRTHHSYKLQVEDARRLGVEVLPILRSEGVPLDTEHQAFIEGLLECDGLMGFLFVQDIESDGRRFESVTLSLGRKNAERLRHRDRLDLILECEIVDGASTGLSRLRAFVDPFEPGRKEAWLEHVVEGASGQSATALLAALSGLHHLWRHDASKAWNHWTQNYIDYFAPRVEPVDQTYFPTPIDDLRQRLNVVRRREEARTSLSV
jgi:hypothetical protein